MTSSPSTALPPRWADSLIRMLLAPEDRDNVSGDLLEEYRESIVPALGRKADGWYVRQVAGYVLHNLPRAWIGAVLVGTILVARYLVDSLAPVQYTPGIIHPRSAIMSYSLIATFGLCSGWQAWRSGHLRSGVLVAFITAVFGGALSVVGRSPVWRSGTILTRCERSRAAAVRGGAVGPAVVARADRTHTESAGAVAGRLANALGHAVSRGTRRRVTVRRPRRRPHPQRLVNNPPTPAASRRVRLRHGEAGKVRRKPARANTNAGWALVAVNQFRGG